MLAPSSCLRLDDRVDGGAGQCPNTRGLSDSGISKRESRCGSRSRAPPRASPALAARSSSRTLTISPASVSRPSWWQAGSVPSMPSGDCGSSMTDGLADASGVARSRLHRPDRRPFTCAGSGSDVPFNGIARRPRLSSFTSFCMLLDSERIHPPAVRSRNRSTSDAVTNLLEQGVRNTCWCTIRGRPGRRGARAER